MATDKNWFRSRLADQLVMFTNVTAKIAAYQAVLPLTAGQVTQIQTICQIFITSYNFVEQARQTMQSLTSWRDIIFNGEPVGDPAPPEPVFGVLGGPLAGWTIGILDEFRELRELIVASPGYTVAIGEDLMIVAPESTGIDEGEVAPSLKVTTQTGYAVTVAGSMQGMDAMRVEYQRNGTTAWSIAAFLTKLPGEFTITPAQDAPENGRIRAAVFIKKNQDFGNFSPEYPVTVA